MLDVLICKTDVPPFVLCGCEIWCLTSREEHRLKVCIVQGGEENIWCGREVGIEGCRRFCSELHDCYCSPDIINIIIARKIIHM